MVSHPYNGILVGEKVIKLWKNLKHVRLGERKQSEKAAYTIPTGTHSGKGTNQRQ